MNSIIDSIRPAFEQDLPWADAILDTVGGSTLQRCVARLKPGGKLVTSVSAQPLPAGAVFFYAEVTTARLQTLTTMFDAGRTTRACRLNPAAFRGAPGAGHAGGRTHKSGKIVLRSGARSKTDLRSKVWSPKTLGLIGNAARANARVTDSNPLASKSHCWVSGRLEARTPVRKLGADLAPRPFGPRAIESAIRCKACRSS